MDYLADEGGIGGEGISPEVVAEDGSLRSAGTVFLFTKAAAESGANAQNIEVVRRDAAVVDVIDPVPGFEVRAGRQRRRDSGDERGHIVAQTLPLSAVDPAQFVGGVRALFALKEGSDAIGLRVGQALQHQRVHHGKDGRIGADGERQGEDDGRREARIAGELPQSLAKIPTERAHA